MTRTVIFGIVGVAVVGTAIALAAGRSQETKQEQQAKQELEARETQAEQAREELQAKTRQREQEMQARANAQRERLEAEAKARQQQLEASTEQRVDSLEARTEEQKARLEQQASQQRDNIQAGVDQAKERVEAAQRQAEAQAQPVAAPSEISGTVASINPDTRTLAVREDAGGAAAASQLIMPTQLKVGEGITVMHAGQRLSLRDVQVGDKVRLQLQGASGQRTVHTIVISQRTTPAS